MVNTVNLLRIPSGCKVITDIIFWTCDSELHAVGVKLKVLISDNTCVHVDSRFSEFQSHIYSYILFNVVRLSFTTSYV